VCYSRLTVYAYVMNFVSIGLFCRHLAVKNPNILNITSNRSPYAIYGTVVLSVLSETLVYCGQTVGWIKMPLSTEVGRGQRRHWVRWRPSFPMERDTIAPVTHFSAHFALTRSPLSAIAELFFNKMC